MKINKINLIFSVLFYTTLSGVFSHSGYASMQVEYLTEQQDLQNRLDSDGNAIGEVKHEIEYTQVDRVANLEKFFEKYNSPLKEHADVFVEVADEYNIDYRLLPAISGVESTFCKNILEGSYNCYGWGIYGNNAIYFNDYEEGIRTVAKGLNDGYFEQGLDTVNEISYVYTPPNPSRWAGNVNYFINDIESVSTKHQ